MDRRNFLALTGAAVVQAAVPRTISELADYQRRSAAKTPKPDFTLRIAPVSLEIAPGQIIKTIGYNGMVPGPVLRMKEGVKTTVEVHNDSDFSELVHWHGLMVPAEVDGAAEEGTKPVPAHGTARYTFVPRPSGTRWYHTHNSGGSTLASYNLAQSTFNGQFGFLYVEPKREPGQYDREVFIAMHHWEPSLAHMGPSNNGFEIEYRYASFNGKALGHGEPIRVRRGERVLFRILNASATDDVSIALPGHHFKVIAMDGNPVPNPQNVDVLLLGVAERIDAIVEMNEPGVWVFGSTRDAERAKGMGVVIEYAGQQGEPKWIAPARTKWDYTIFGSDTATPEPDGRFEMVFEKVPGNRVDFNHWTINGKSFPDTPELVLQKGKRYRLIFNNKSGDSHPVHLHRHSFEITSVAGKRTAGVMKDVVSVSRQSTAEVDFVANNPGLTLFHCHTQIHMDFGFMQLLKYA